MIYYKEEIRKEADIYIYINARKQLSFSCVIFFAFDVKLGKVFKTQTLNV